MKYPNDMITDRSECTEQSEWYQEYLAETPKAPGWLPFPRYQMIQTGFPTPDHGEMITFTDVGTDAEGRVLPFLGMWCKVEDIAPIVEERDALLLEVARLRKGIENARNTVEFVHGPQDLEKVLADALEGESRP